MGDLQGGLCYDIDLEFLLLAVSLISVFAGY